MMQLDIEDVIAANRRDVGMARAIDHADREQPGWKDDALEFLEDFARRNSKPFLAEDVVSQWRLLGNPSPPDGRAWGGVIRSAASQGTICKVGYAPANTSNRSPKCLWAAA